jgi:hypothetical protein
MPGRHQVTLGRRPRLRWAGWAGAVLVLALTAAAFLGFSSAGASTVVRAQLTLSGLANSDNPLGGSQIGVHPGDTVEFSPSTAPTAGLDKLGLGGLVSGLLNSLASFQVTADFSHLPGGNAKTVIGAKTKPIDFHFTSAGTYNFTWSAQKIGLLGNVVPINLDGNQLAKAGIKLNASNQYVGKVVVADNPPKGGISIQLPGVSVAPSIGGHQLPTLGVPGVSLPTIKVQVPDLNPTKPAGGSGGGGNGGGGAGGGANGGGTQTGIVLPVPARVVPHGDGDAVFGNAGGGYVANALPGSVSQLDGSSSLLPASSGGGAAKGSAVPDQKSTGKHKTIDLAATKAQSAQLPVVLAIIAIIALSLVAATYARLYLLRRDQPTA